MKTSSPCLETHLCKGTSIESRRPRRAYFLESSTESIFGNSIDTLKPGKGQFDTEKFLAAFDTVLQGIGLRVALGKFAFLQSLDKFWKKARDEVYIFVDQQIERAIEEAAKAKKTSSPTNSPSPNRRIVLLDEPFKTTQDRISLRLQLLNIFITAGDQTAIAVENIFFHLARHPEVWRRLQNEVSNYDGPLTYESLKQMKYSKAIVNESKFNSQIIAPLMMVLTQYAKGLRILALFGRSIRSCGKDCILSTGGGSDGKDPVLFVRGTEVNYVFRSMHLDKDIWGADADEFRPERWEKIEKAQLQAYIPFPKGDRVFSAQKMVLNECVYILVRFAKTFKSLENRDPKEKFVEQHKLQKESMNEVKVSFGL
ncbi:putative cytochrome p450 alkane hydroxylase protein [Botrytis fragariae]|uniref:Putative cytochrome p450 alkane hydroxylase protein n=1 Tax=Botrytis fragariae TaxID=1964551 RepID=A0A8H6AKL6_9HELO|nr:putative cytochrome p450 alkane hydroxylase protein [Botrytis fragariae]KAF5869332.1 putative cytochrome p450 alkane hydroxylase protein [Botrytis fragariae]